MREIGQLIGTELPVEVAELGVVRHRFSVPADRVLRSLLIGPAAIICGVLLLVISQIAQLMGWGGWTGIPTILLLIFVGFLLLGAGGGTIQLALQHCGEQFIVLSRGFARIRKSRVELYPWDEISAVRQFQWPEAATMKGMPKKFTTILELGHAILRSGNIVKLRRKDGKKLRLDDFIENVVGLTSIIQAETAKAMLPSRLGEFEAGATLDFGALSLSNSGIGLRKRVVEWANVSELALERHMLLVYERGRAMYAIGVGYQQIPNLHVFLALVRHALASVSDDQARLIRVIVDHEA